MNVFRGFSCLICLALFAVFSPGANAQCFVQLMGYCANEQFDDPCSWPCNAVGDDCGMSMEGDQNLTFSDLEGSNEGLDEYDTYPEPRWCGYIVRCRCVGGLVGLPVGCDATSERISDFSVTEYYAEGAICVDDSPSIP